VLRNNPKTNPHNDERRVPDQGNTRRSGDIDVPILTDLPTENTTADHRCGSVSVFGTRARVSDKQAVKALLKRVPDAHLVRPRLNHNGSAHHWDSKREIDFWIFFNGLTVLCLEILGLDVVEADRSRKLFEDRSRRAGGNCRVAWVEEILREATNSPLTRH
jgi:hypothetical protein